MTNKKDQRKQYRRIGFFCLVCLLCFGLLCGCAGRTSETDTEDIESVGETEDTQDVSATRIVLTTGFEQDEVFRIGKSSCYQDEFMVYLTNIQNRYESVYGDAIWSVSANGVSMETRVKESAVARIAQVKAMNLLAEEYQVSLTDEEEKRAAQAASDYYASLNETEIAAMGATAELLTQLYREYRIAYKVYDYMIRDINPEISDDEARNVTVKWIFLRSADEDTETEALAEEILKQLAGGEDFDALATAYSDDQTVTHTFGKGEADEAVEECAFNLAEGETGDVVKGADGYYIIRCVSTLDREETDANKEKIITQRKKEAFNEAYGTFVDEQVKQFNEELWTQIGMVHDANVTTESFFDVYEQYFSEE